MPAVKRGGVAVDDAGAGRWGGTMAAMRWHRLFEDLAAQQEALERREREAEFAEHTRAERGQVELLQRLAAVVAGPVRLRVQGVGVVEGTLTDVGADWILLATPVGGQAGRELLLPAAALLTVEGLSGRAETDPATASRRLGLRHALRAVSRDRAPVRVHDVSGEHLTGTIDAVLADHLDLSRHADDEPRRGAAVRGRVSLPYSALAGVRRL